MKELITPELIQEQKAIVKILIWIGSVIITAMASSIVVLWITLERRNKYIYQQDKENRSLLMEIANNYKAMGVDISRIENITSNHLKPNISAIRGNISL